MLCHFHAVSLLMLILDTTIAHGKTQKMLEKRDWIKYHLGFVDRRMLASWVDTA